MRLLTRVLRIIRAFLIFGIVVQIIMTTTGGGLPIVWSIIHALPMIGIIALIWFVIYRLETRGN